MCYFAAFLPAPGVPGDYVRHDTRVYLRDGRQSQATGTPVAAVVGKNPGSALPGVPLGTWGPLILGCDKLLPNVRSIFQQAYTKKGKPFPEDAYVQILNLSYFCSKVLAGLTAHLRAGRSFPTCAREDNTFPLLWFVWGSPNPLLTPLKARFALRKEPHQFFYDTAEKAVVAKAPLTSVSARHTQGLIHAPIVEHLATLL